MGYEQPGLSITRLAAADLSTHQFKFVNIDAGGNASLSGVGGRSVGVLQNKPISGRAATIVVDGISKIVAGGVVAAGASVASDATGRAVTAAATNLIQGVALQAAAGAGEIIAVLILRGAAAQA